MINKKSDQDKLKHTLRNMRKKANKTIEQLAEELGVSRQTISNWESGKSTPDTISFMKFAKAYDPSLENFRSLLNIEDDSTKPDELSDWGRHISDYLNNPHPSQPRLGLAFSSFIDKKTEMVLSNLFGTQYIVHFDYS